MHRIFHSAPPLAKLGLAAAVFIVSLGLGGCSDPAVPNQAPPPDPNTPPPYAQQPDPRAAGGQKPAPPPDSRR